MGTPTVLVMDYYEYNGAPPFEFLTCDAAIEREKDGTYGHNSFRVSFFTKMNFLVLFGLTRYVLHVRIEYATTRVCRLVVYIGVCCTSQMCPRVCDTPELSFSDGGGYSYCIACLLLEHRQKVSKSNSTKEWYRTIPLC